MNDTINAMIKEQFGTAGVSDKVWFVMTTDNSNIARVPVDESGRFHPAVLLEGIHGDTKADALMTFKRCFHKTAYAVVETVEEAKKTMPYSTIIKWDGTFVQRAGCDYE